MITFRQKLLSVPCMSALAASIGSATVSPATAQGTNTGQDVDEIVVTGSNIRGARINAALPVTVLGEADIAAVGGIDGDDLIRSLPAQGSTNFRNDNIGTVNSARGDVGSINLRSIGSSGTLVLLNGRRVVNHPGTQAELSTPVTTVNTNALPVAGIRRLEVLTDGASAIYGSDAVAGVVNTILETDYEGFQASFRYGTAENTELDDQRVIIKAGKDFNEGRTNISFFGEYSRRDGYTADEQEFTANADLRSRLEGTSFEGDTSFDNRSTSSPWGQFTVNTTSSTRVSQNGENLTTSSGRFHIQPTSVAGCRAELLSDSNLCIDDSSLDRDLRYNIYRGRTISSPRDRFNLFTFLNHEVSDTVDLYGEFGFYYARTRPRLAASSPIGSGNITIPANYYYNPFGPVTFSDGTPNPNRLPGLENVPDEGLPISLDAGRYRFVDGGPREVDVTNTSWRALIGMRGQLRETKWDWDSAVLVSRAKTNDVTGTRISSTLFQNLLFNETPDVYNIFSGGDPDNPSGDDTTSSRAFLQPAIIDVRRLNRTGLILGDFKVSTGDAWTLPGGGLGLAFGSEVRQETFFEDRDDRLDGTVTFTDAVSGLVSDSDVVNTSATADSEGSRVVFAGFAEASIPVVSPDMGVPLVNTFDVQAAARIEHYSDFGSSGIKPRIAAAWKPFDAMKFRGAWSLGFRAPNLAVINRGVSRVNTREDALLCQAGVLNGTFADFSDCEGFSETREERRVAEPNIGPEDARSITYGLVFEPRGLEGALSFLNGLTITVDRWEIEREGVVGVFGAENQINFDLVQRLNGSTNPNVVREEADEDDVAFFAGTGLAPAGDIIFINDTYDNNEDQTIAGTDFALYYDVDTDIGDFGLRFNATKLREYFIDLSPGAQAISDAVDAGLISDDISVTQEGNIIRDEGQPRWRTGATLTYRHRSGVGFGARHEFIGSFIDTGAGLNDDDEPFVVESWQTINFYGQYDIDADGPLGGTRLRVGVNNLLDKQPPLADETFGYFNEYHSARGRYFYFDVRKQF